MKADFRFLGPLSRGFKGYAWEVVRCHAHRRYKGNRKPLSTCEWCWRLWVSRHEVTLP